MGKGSAQVRDLFIQEQLIQIKQIHLSKEIAEKSFPIPAEANLRSRPRPFDSNPILKKGACS